MPKELYTASEAASALGVSLDTLRRWDKSGRIRTTRLGLEDQIVASGPDQCVTWNAPSGGIVRHGTGLAVDAWVPRLAPPSRSALAPLQSLTPPAAAPQEFEK